MENAGIKTTEFWLAGLGVLFISLFGLLMVYGVVNQEQATAWLALIAAVVALIVPVAIAYISRSYTVSRTAVKTASIESAMRGQGE